MGSSCVLTPHRRLHVTGTGRRAAGRAALALLGESDQLRSRQLKSCGQPPETRVARIALSRLDVGDPALVQFGLVGQLLLGQTELLAARFHGQTEGGLKGW